MSSTRTQSQFHRLFSVTFHFGCCLRQLPRLLFASQSKYIYIYTLTVDPLGIVLVIKSNYFWQLEQFF